MKQRYLLAFALPAVLLAACATSRKAAAPQTASVTPPVPAAPRPSNGVYTPGEAELAAIRAARPGATMETLAEGYRLYTGDGCTRCHGVKGIYSRAADTWPGIIDDMAPRAKLTATQHEAVLSYVLSIKAAQAK